jgi:hypothetical protein
MKNLEFLICPYDGFKLRTSSPSYIKFLRENASAFYLVGKTRLNSKNDSIDNINDGSKDNLEYPIEGEFKGFKITIQKNKNDVIYVDIEGSFHKFSQEGKNYKHFYWRDFTKAYAEIVEQLSLDPEMVKVVNLEVGINLYIPDWWVTTPQKIAANILYLNPRKKASKKNILEFKEFGYSWCSMHDQYWIKIYDKSIQNLLQNERIIRLEKRHIKSHPLQKHGLFRMCDLLNYEVVESLTRDLVKTLNKLIIYQIELNHLITLSEDDKTFLLQYAKPEAWQEAHKDRNLFRSVKRKYLNLVKRHCRYNLKSEMIKELELLIKSQYSMLVKFPI